MRSSAPADRSPQRRAIRRAAPGPSRRTRLACRGRAAAFVDGVGLNALHGGRRLAAGDGVAGQKYGPQAKGGQGGGKKLGFGHQTSVDLESADARGQGVGQKTTAARGRMHAHKHDRPGFAGVSHTGNRSGTVSLHQLRP